MAIAERIPKGSAALFFIQIFSTLGYSVLYSTIVLYATKRLGLPDGVTTSIMASFVAFNFALHLFGGYLGGRFLSYRHLFVLSMVFQVIGCLALVGLSEQSLYWGLAVFLAGSGFNSIMINCMVTQLFQPQDKRRETAFLWNYSGMNLGFFVGFFVAGYFQIQQNYFMLFLLTSIGNCLALVVAFANWKVLRDVHTHLSTGVRLRAIRAVTCILILVILIFLLRWLLVHARFSNELIMWVGLAMGLVLVYFALAQKQASARHKLWAYIILSLGAVIFWTLYQLLPMGLTLFIERNVDRTIGHFQIPPQWFQNVDTIVIIFGGPLMAFVFKKLRKRGFHITIPMLFATALTLIGISLAILPLGIHLANAGGYTGWWWIVIAYFLLAVGELFISPIGFSMVGLLAPMNLRGILMGVTLMISGLGATFSNYFSQAAVGSSVLQDPHVTNSSFSHTFSLLGWISIGVGIILYVLVPLLLKLTSEKNLTLTPKSQSLPS